MRFLTASPLDRLDQSCTYALAACPWTAAMSSLALLLPFAKQYSCTNLEPNMLQPVYSAACPLSTNTPGACLQLCLQLSGTG